MGLTRGSRTEIEHGPISFNSTSMKEWGKRQFSNDWTHRFKGKKSIVTGGSSEERSRSREFGKPEESISSKPPASPQKPLHHVPGCTTLTPFLSSSFTFPFFFLDENSNRKFTFPSRKSRKELEPLQLNNSNTVTGEYYYPRSGTMRTGSRSRAPSLRSTPSSRRTQYAVQNNIVTPTRSSLRLPLQRSNSQGGPYTTNTWSASSNNNNNIPKSAKKWGRTAHLHEVRSAVPHTVLFSSSTGGGQKSKKRGSSERPLGPRAAKDDSEDVFSVLRRPQATTSVDDEDPWVDTGSESGSTDL